MELSVVLRSLTKLSTVLEVYCYLLVIDCAVWIIERSLVIKGIIIKKSGLPLHFVSAGGLLADNILMIGIDG